MSLHDHEGTDALTRLADEVEEERRTKGHTAFDAQDESADRQTGETRSDEDTVNESSVDSRGDTLPPLQSFGH